jgi:hypothetical protein
MGKPAIVAEEVDRHSSKRNKGYVGCVDFNVS